MTDLQIIVLIAIGISGIATAWVFHLTAPADPLERHQAAEAAMLCRREGAANAMSLDEFFAHFDAALFFYAREALVIDGERSRLRIVTGPGKIACPVCFVADPVTPSPDDFAHSVAAQLGLSEEDGVALIGASDGEARESALRAHFDKAVKKSGVPVRLMVQPKKVVHG